MFCTSDPSLNWWWVMAWTSSGLMHTHTWTHTGTEAGNDNTWRPKMALGKKWPAKSTSQACSSHDTAVVFYVTLCCMCSWRPHQMETFSGLLALCVGNSPVTGEFPSQRPEMRSFDVFFDLCLNKRLSKQSWGWWFETQPRSLWHHHNVVLLSDSIVQQ